MLKYSVVYSSPTGNTEMLANKLREILPEEDCAFFGAPSDARDKLSDSEVVFLGFWTCRKDADAETKGIFSELQNKKVFLFGTAGFASNGDYYEEILNKIKEQFPETTEYLGGFLCAGKMPQETCLKYRAALLDNPNNVPIMRMIDNFDRAATHPDDNDLSCFASVVLNLTADGAFRNS